MPVNMDFSVTKINFFSDRFLSTSRLDGQLFSWLRKNILLHEIVVNLVINVELENIPVSFPSFIHFSAGSPLQKKKKPTKNNDKK